MRLARSAGNRVREERAATLQVPRGIREKHRAVRNDQVSRIVRGKMHGRFQCEDARVGEIVAYPFDFQKSAGELPCTKSLKLIYKLSAGRSRGNLEPSAMHELAQKTPARCLRRRGN